MKKSLRFLLTSLKWLVLTAVAVEVFCFLLVTASNYLIYGHAFEGSRVLYDPYALFLSEEGPRPTVHNPANPDAPELRNLAAMTAKRYEHVRKMAGCYGAGVLLIWQPILWVETGAVAPQVREQEQKYPVQDERFLSAHHNFTVVYHALAESLQDKPCFFNFRNVLCPRSQPVYEPDGVHLKAAGDEMVARDLGRVLQERWQQK